MINFIIAQIFGLVALIILVISFQKNKKERLLKLQMFSSLLYAIQYIFLKAYTGFFMNIICMIRNLIFNKFKNKRPPLYCLVIIIALMISCSIFTFNGIISILPTIAVSIYSIALWIGNMKIIRVVEIISCILFIIYDIKVLAILGLIATIIEMISAIIALYKFDIKTKCNNN